MSNLLKSVPFWVTTAVIAILAFSTLRAHAEPGGGLVCKTQKGVEAVFNIGNANPRLSMPEAVGMVNSVDRIECAIARFDFELGKVVGNVTHDAEGMKGDIYEATIEGEKMYVVRKHKEVSKLEDPFR